MKMMAIALPTSEGTKYYHLKTVGMGYSNSGPAGCRASDNVPRKVASIMNYAEPRDEIEMKRFLGMCNQFSKFFPDLSHMAKPLWQQLKKSI